ncbi:hypothetical protein GB881_15105 [Georgenia subflava]|uniref:Energy-coupling factor transporter transmembrane protein EcfT n=1 Tax=Georgenia subflava TaxID=1622177 RepID=A0A6N7ELP2_9MICO|nr:hypothetical protein [Georgenia subflava]
MDLPRLHRHLHRGDARRAVDRTGHRRAERAAARARRRDHGAVVDPGRGDGLPRRRPRPARHVQHLGSGGDQRADRDTDISGGLGAAELLPLRRVHDLRGVDPYRSHQRLLRPAAVPRRRRLARPGRADRQVPGGGYRHARGPLDVQARAAAVPARRDLRRRPQEGPSGGAHRVVTLPAGVSLVSHANPVRNLNPTTHVVLAVVLAVISQLFGLWSVGAVVLVSALIALIARRLGAFLRAWAPTVLLLSVVIVALQTLFIEGPTILFSWWILDGTAEGLERGTTFAARIMGVATPLVLAVQLGDRRRSMLELERRRVPPKATYVVVAAMNLIPEMRKQLDAIMDAQRARGVETDANWFVRVRAFLPSLIPLILSSILSVEEKALALQSRGFTLTGPRTSLYAVVDTRTDRVLRAVLWAVLALAVVGRILLWVL